MSISRLLFVSLCLSALACGGSKPPPKTEDSAKNDAPRDDTGTGGLSVEQELGSLDEQAVAKKFDELLNGKLEGCHKQGRERLEFLAGDAKVFLRIGKDGRVKYGYLEESTLGDRDTEKCILDALSGADWPKPKGGEGEARHTFGWSAGNERQPTPWESAKVSGALDEEKDIKKGVERCKVGVNGEFRVTAYVEPGEPPGEHGGATAPAPAAGKEGEVHHGSGKGQGKSTGKGAAKGGGKKPGRKGDKKGAGKGGEHGGKFKAIGIVAPNREGIDKMDCLVDALRPLPLPSPGSYVAKVTFAL